MLNDNEFKKLLGYLDRPWDGFRKVRKKVKKRIRLHMEELGYATVEGYLVALDLQPEVRAECEHRLMVTISRFFRDRQLWQAFRERLMPALIERFEPPIRIWSAGCAGGEEPYSLAMVWQSLPGAPPLELLATDADVRCLDRARTGVYGRSSLKDVPDDIRTLYFDPNRSGRQFQIKSRLLTPIDWRPHQLLNRPPPGSFHAILLRNNLLTYHQGASLQAAFGRILTVLAPGGYLVVGSHEKLPASSFALVRDEKCPWVYQWAKNASC
jgi:chemotaxis protein methyltransferase CheR